MRAYRVALDSSPRTIWYGTLTVASKDAKAIARGTVNGAVYIDECDVKDDKAAIINLMRGEPPQFEILRSWLVEKGRRGYHLTELREDRA